MPTHVYANGREIACQAADGIASPAFPDPCWTPPPPPAGPVVIPYANTARPKTLKKGSRKVFIGGKPVALGDKSYFSTSIGDEPATHGLAKGVISGVIKGKAYFRSWSMNVIIEGHGVARHLDRMTHNHGSSPGNTPPFPYLSRQARDKDCKEEAARIGTECGPEDKWAKTHCKGLSKRSKQSTRQNALQAALEKASNKKEALAKVKSLLADMATHASDTTLPYATEVSKRLTSIEGQLKDFKNLGKEIQKKLIKTLVPDATDDAGTRATLNATLATLNDCLVARKCRLVPYNEEAPYKDDDEKIKAAPARKGGCCSAQTGYHLIPKTMTKEINGGHCANYNHNAAPTVCVEGTNHGHGTHGLIHAKLDGIVKELVEKPENQGQRTPDGKLYMTLDQATTAAAKSHSETFPSSACSEQCIKAQLDAYYRNACPKKEEQEPRLGAVDKCGHKHKLDTPESLAD